MCNMWYGERVSKVSNEIFKKAAAIGWNTFVLASVYGDKPPDLLTIAFFKERDDASVDDLLELFPHCTYIKETKICEHFSYYYGDGRKLHFTVDKG